MKFTLKRIKKIRLNLKFLLICIILIYIFLGPIFYFSNKILPRVKISGTNVGGQATLTAQKTLAREYNQKVSILPLAYQNQNFTLDLKKAVPKIEIEQAVKDAYSPGHGSDFFKNIYEATYILLFGKDITPKISFGNLNALTLQMNQINLEIKKDPKPAQIILGEKVTVVPSEEGLEVDREILISQIQNYLNLTESPPKNLPTRSSQPKFTTEKAQDFQKILENMSGKTLTLRFEENSLEINQQILLSLLDTKEGKDIISREKVAKFLEDLSLQINRPVQDAKFVFDPNTKRVREFKPAEEGKELDISQTAEMLSQTLLNPVASASAEIALPVKVTKPQTGTAETNSFGITGLLGGGLSHFAGSIENRIYNIKLAASRINGTLIAPGAVFSFNRTVGDISAASGYKQAYVIKEGRTVLDDGGGVCQVSTTLFRAALNSGLPIVKRTAHAYRVGYYEQGFPPGLDATVFAPSVDFQFKNDTGAHILVQAYIYGTSLYVDLYGAPDGRTVSITKPVVADQTPPPPELRQDDPTLPRGEFKQVDWPAWGANVTFYRTVKRDSETIISDKWFSSYKPWQAIYLVGTKE